MQKIEICFEQDLDKHKHQRQNLEKILSSLKNSN